MSKDVIKTKAYVFRTSDILVWAAILILSINAVSGWAFKNKTENMQVAVISMDAMIEASHSIYISRGQPKETAMMNSAYFVDFIKEELSEINRSGRYRLIVDIKAVYGGDAVNITKEVYDGAMARAGKVSPSINLNGYAGVGASNGK